MLQTLGLDSEKVWEGLLRMHVEMKHYYKSSLVRELDIRINTLVVHIYE